MLARTITAGVPRGWFAADTGYSRDPDLRAFCHDHALAYVMAPDGPATGRLAGIRLVLPGHPDRPDPPVGASSGRRGQQRAPALRLGDARGAVKEQDPADGVAHTLLVRRSKQMKHRKGWPDSYDIEFFLVHAPVGPPLAVMVRTAGVRWRIEEDNKTGKDQLGMDAYQVRKWVGWHRHGTMCMLAQAFLAVTRASQGNAQCLGRSGGRLSSIVLPLSTAAIRGLLAATTLLRAVGVTAAVACAMWRQVHQTRAITRSLERPRTP